LDNNATILKEGFADLSAKNLHTRNLLQQEILDFRHDVVSSHSYIKTEVTTSNKHLGSVINYQNDTDSELNKMMKEFAVMSS